MLRCAGCDKPIRECCDIYFEATDLNGKSCVLCGECAEKYAAPEDEEEGS